ncbi:DUF3592 domain-containing protein [Streptomyces sp. NPDC058290]|uniref:DUF3592 domain-containing protein n=1 Tax=Streptomyces sp. NPDC058290 TaxID=3346426 RepID=UPI0036F02F24
MPPSSTLWILSLAFALPGAVLAAVSCHKVRETRRLLRDGVRAQGVVIRLEAMRMEGAGSGDSITIRSTGTTAYAPVVAWTTADGRAMETSSNVARPLNRTPAVGTRVEVRYDPANPSRWILPAGGNGLWWVFVGVGALFTVIGLGFGVGALYA